MGCCVQVIWYRWHPICIQYIHPAAGHVLFSMVACMNFTISYCPGIRIWVSFTIHCSECTAIARSLSHSVLFRVDNSPWVLYTATAWVNACNNSYIIWFQYSTSVDFVHSYYWGIDYNSSQPTSSRVSMATFPPSTQTQMAHWTMFICS